MGRRRAAPPAICAKPIRGHGAGTDGAGRGVGMKECFRVTPAQGGAAAPQEGTLRYRPAGRSPVKPGNVIGLWGLISRPGRCLTARRRDGLEQMMTPFAIAGIQMHVGHAKLEACASGWSC